MVINYTELSLTLLWFSLWFKNMYLLTLCKSNTLLILVAFTLVPLFDPTAYERMRQRHRYNLFIFWLGHIILHVAPLMLLYDIKCTWWDGVRASIMHLTWVSYESRGTFLLNHVYVPLRRNVWIACSFYAYAFAILFPLAFQ